MLRLSRAACSGAVASSATGAAIHTVAFHSVACPPTDRSARRGPASLPALDRRASPNLANLVEPLDVAREPAPVATRPTAMDDGEVEGRIRGQESDPDLEGGLGNESVRSARRLVRVPGLGRVDVEVVPSRRLGELLRRTRSLAIAARWRLLALFGAFLATIPTWPALDGVFRNSPNFEAGELVLLVAIVLLVPIAWVVVDPVPGRLPGALLVASAAGWSFATRLWASWATPPAVDDVLRGYLAVGCAIVVTALWLDRHRNPIIRRSWLGLALLAVACAAVVALPAVGDASIPERDALLPLPRGIVIVTEDAGCESR